MKASPVHLARHLIRLICVLSALCLRPSAGWAEAFPEPPVIEPAVRFWLSIYTRFGLAQGVLHDSRHPEIIYGVIDLVPPEAPSARRINERRMYRARSRYRQLIDRYLQDPDSDRPGVKRMVALFGRRPDPKHLDRAKRRIRCQVGQRERFREGLIRAAPYHEAIGRIFRKTGLPEDLIYLAHVESSFNTEAHSKYGAAGIWQFTRRTGRHYMRIDQAVDERLDPLRSSEAAAQLLKANYRRLESWPLAITAYNHGLSGMRCAQRRHVTYAAIYANYRSRRFGFASRSFYPEFLAAREAGSNAHLYFEPLPPRAAPETFQLVLDRFVPFLSVVNHFDLTTETLVRFNPALRPPVLSGLLHIPQGYTLRLPDHEWRNRLAFSARIPSHLMASQQKTLPVYRVRKGDTIAAIASRHNIKVADLVAANKLLEQGNHIYVNQALRIPMGKRPL